MNAALRILEEASAIVDGVTCDCSTECCRFGLTGREPWLTRAEFDVVTAHVKAQGRRLPTVPAAKDGRCAFLGDDDKCQVYAARPLGCRTFFCDNAKHPDGRTGRLPTATNKALRGLPRELLALHPGEESKPLGAWLTAATPAKKKQSR